MPGGEKPSDIRSPEAQRGIPRVHDAAPQVNSLRKINDTEAHMHRWRGPSCVSQVGSCGYIVVAEKGASGADDRSI